MINNINKMAFFIALFVCGILPRISFGQNILNATDLSQIKVEKLSANDLKQIRAELDKNNTTLDAIEPALMAKGMSPTNYSLLKAKLQNDAPKTNVDIGSQIELKPIELNAEPIVNPKEFSSKIFGSEIFTNPALSFEPNSNMATPINYILGAGDELQIVIYGIQEFATQTVVSKEGKISIPNVGQFVVSGMSLEATNSLIKNLLNLTSCSTL